MSVPNNMKPGDKKALDEIKEEYDYRFTQVLGLYDMRDMLVRERCSIMDVTRQIAEHQTRMRYLDEKLHHICRLPVAVSHLDIIPVVTKPETIWTDEDCDKGDGILIYAPPVLEEPIPYHSARMMRKGAITSPYVSPIKGAGKPRGPYKRRKPRRDIQAIANGILNVETE
jgi:hypothetical protein